MRDREVLPIWRVSVNWLDLRDIALTRYGRRILEPAASSRSERRIM
jgi:hypothetical protein